MTILMRIIDGELQAKGFRDIEVGFEDDLLDLDRLMENDLGETLESYFTAIFGLETDMVEPSHVYLSDEGVLFAPSFIQEGESVSITDTQVKAKSFTEKDSIE